MGERETAVAKKIQTATSLFWNGNCEVSESASLFTCQTTNQVAGTGIDILHILNTKCRASDASLGTTHACLQQATYRMKGATAILQTNIATRKVTNLTSCHSSFLLLMICCQEEGDEKSVVKEPFRRMPWRDCVGEGTFFLTREFWLAVVFA